MVHILGAGAIGSLVAVSLRGVPTLVLRNESKRLHFSQLENTLRIIGKSDLAKKVQAVAAPNVGNIDTLVVCTKASSTLEALRPLASKLGPSSKLVLLQNGIGVERQLGQLWPENPPQISFGITAQGVKATPVAYTFEHTGQGPFVFPEGSLGPDDFESFASVLSVSATEFERQRVLKLLVNAVINPLTAVLDCANGLVASPQLRPSVDRLVAESCTILNAEYKFNFSPQEVVAKVLQVAEDTSTNTSSMRADVLQGQPTEIEYINGHIIELADKHGLKALRNRFLRDLLLLKGENEQAEASKAVPWRRPV